MKLLFIHPNIPGQYKHLVKAYAENPKNTVVFISKTKENFSMPNVHHVAYETPHGPSPATHRYLVGAERSVLQGQEVWRVCRKLKEEEGFIPDVICCHPGWGDGLFLKDIYPDTPLLSYFEFYYSAKGADVGFDPEIPFVIDDKARIRVKNVTNLLNLEAADWGISPTHWQHSLHPEVYQPKISVLHEGIDTRMIKPMDDASLQIGDAQITLKKGDPVITYVARNFEHYRGSHQFFRAAKIMLEEHPTAHIIAIGADDVSYGRQRGGKALRIEMLEQLNLDRSRIHFPGQVNYDAFQRILQISSAHVYLTVPFVLSWSLLESMATECVVIASDTQPVREVIEHGKNGLMVDFFSPEQIAKAVLDVLARPADYMDIRKAARQTVVDRYDLQKILPLQMKLIEQVAAKQFPPAVQTQIEALYDRDVKLRLAS